MSTACPWLGVTASLLAVSAHSNISSSCSWKVLFILDIKLFTSCTMYGGTVWSSSARDSTRTHLICALSLNGIYSTGFISLSWPSDQQIISIIFLYFLHLLTRALFISYVWHSVTQDFTDCIIIVPSFSMLFSPF